MRKYATGLAMALAMTSAAIADDTVYPNDHLIITATELNRLIQTDRDRQVRAQAEIDLVDVRVADAFVEGHIAGAQSLPVSDLTDPDGPIEGMLRSEAELSAMFAAAGLDAASHIVLYDDRGGFRAARLFWLLELYGYRNVSILDGGIDAWTKQGLALSTGRGKASVGHDRFPLAFTSRRLASADWIMERQEDDETVVVDVRPSGLFAQGHIPWAHNVPWAANLDADGTMLDPDALAAHFADAGIDPEDNVVIHCQTGEASAHSYFALRLLGYPRVRVYHRSWAEWGSDADLPRIATHTD